MAINQVFALYCIFMNHDEDKVHNFKKRDKEFNTVINLIE